MLFGIAAVQASDDELVEVSCRGEAVGWCVARELRCAERELEGTTIGDFESVAEQIGAI